MYVGVKSNGYTNIIAFLGESSYVYSVEYFGVRATINRTRRVLNSEIVCKDCLYLEEAKKKMGLLNNHR